MSNQCAVLGYKKLSADAVAPIKSSPHSVGFDLSSPRNAVIPPHNWITLFTDISINLPAGTYGRIAPRSGLAALHGVSVDAGVIDPDYTGNIGIVLVNRSGRPFIIHAKDRIAQLVCETAEYPLLREVKELQTTAREKAGFGSSGSKALKKQQRGNN